MWGTWFGRSGKRLEEERLCPISQSRNKCTWCFRSIFIKKNCSMLLRLIWPGEILSGQVVAEKQGSVNERRLVSGPRVTSHSGVTEVSWTMIAGTDRELQTWRRKVPDSRGGSMTWSWEVHVVVFNKSNKDRDINDCKDDEAREPAETDDPLLESITANEDWSMTEPTMSWRRLQSRSIFFQKWRR